MSYTLSWLALPVAIIAIALLRSRAEALGVLDQPGGRKTHHGAVPAVGGLGMFAGLLVVSLHGAALDRYGYVILGLAGAMLLLGFVDDRNDLRPRTRLLGQLVAAAALVALTGYAVPHVGDLLGFGRIGLGPFAAVFTVVATVAMINAFNMLDGLDGLAGGCALVTFAGFTQLALGGGAFTLAALGVAVVAVTAGFLCYNLPLLPTRRWRVFMGDAGSTMLGFMIAAFGLVLLQDPGPAVPAALVLWLAPIPVFELYWTTARRLRRGLHPALADDGHWHHALVRGGLSVRMVFLVYMVFSAVSAVIGLRLHAAGYAESTLFLGFVALFLCWVALMTLLPRVLAGVAPRSDAVHRVEPARESVEPPTGR